MDLMRIRPEQMEAFRKQAMANFEDRAVDHLRQCTTEAVAPYSDDHLHMRVRQGIVRAEPYGLTTEQHVMAFVDTTFLVGEDFDTDPGQDWSRLILDSRQFDAEEKATGLICIAWQIFHGRQAKG